MNKLLLVPPLVNLSFISGVSAKNSEGRGKILFPPLHSSLKVCQWRKGRSVETPCKPNSIFRLHFPTLKELLKEAEEGVMAEALATGVKA